MAEKWEERDRIGFFLDFELRRIAFFKNGVLQKDQWYSLPERKLTLYPAVSLICGNQVTLITHSKFPPKLS